MPGVLWTFARLCAVLTPADGMVSFPFTIQTTATTPLGRHTIIIQALSGDMKVEGALILETVHQGKATFPLTGLRLFLLRSSG